MRLAYSLGYEEVLGIDLSAEVVAAAIAEGLNVRQMDIAEYLAHCPDARWSMVTALDVIEHFPRERGLWILQEIRRVLCPEGICLLQLPNALSPWAYGIMASDLTHEAAYSSQSICQLAKLAGFTRGEVRELGPPPGGMLRWFRRRLWRLLRLLYRTANLVETGSCGDGVFSRVMLVKLS